MPRRHRSRELIASLNTPGTFASRDDLLRRWGRVSLDNAVAQGLVVRLAPGLYVHATQAHDFTTRVNVAQAWMPHGCAIAGVAALALHRLTDVHPPSITVMAPAPTHPRAPAWVRVARAQRGIAAVRRSGVRCQVVEDAIIQAWTELSRGPATSLILEAMRRSTVTGAQVTRALARAPRVRDRRALEALLRQALRGIESYLEYHADRTVLNTSGLRDLPRQVPMMACGARYVLDAFHEATRTAIEFDGRSVHAQDAAFQKDRDRDSALATLGILTLRFNYEDVMTRPLWVRQRIRAALGARASGTPLLPRVA